MLGELLQVEHRARREHALVIDLRERRLPRGGPGRDQEVVVLERADSVLGRDLEHAVLGDVTLAVDDLGLGRVEALADRSRLVRGKPARVGDRAQQVDVGPPVLEANADALGVLDGGHHRRGVQQRL